MIERLLEKEKKYVIGVSGGSDSMYLLESLFHLGYHLYVAHVNYHYRHDSDVDYELVSTYCKERNIPFYYREFFPDDFKTGNFQEKARVLRYQFYKEIYDEKHCDGVILGHHLDDCVENIYMQLEKHDFVYYLGMKEESTVFSMKILRPLLDLYKEDILKYVHEKGIPYHDDYTNFETDFYRDKIRNTILNHYTREEKQEMLNKAKQHNQRIKEKEFKLLPYYQQYKRDKKINYQIIKKEDLSFFLYLLLKDIIDYRQISLSLINEIIHQIHSSKPNIQMNLPVNYLFIKEYDNIYIQKNDNQEGYCFTFEKEQVFHCDYFTVAKEGHINEGIYLDQNEYPITIRTMLNGDKMKTAGGIKKVSRLFINAKIPAAQRKTWPIVLNCHNEIILIPHIAKNIDYLTTKPNVFVIK